MDNQIARRVRWRGPVLNDVMTADDDAARAKALAELGQIIRTGTEATEGQETIWRELQESIALKIKTAQAEWRRMNDVGSLIAVEQVAVYNAVVLAAVRETLADRPDMLRAVSQRFVVLMPVKMGGGDREEERWALRHRIALHAASNAADDT